MRGRHVLLLEAEDVGHAVGDRAGDAPQLRLAHAERCAQGVAYVPRHAQAFPSATPLPLLSALLLLPLPLLGDRPCDLDIPERSPIDLLGRVDRRSSRRRQRQGRKNRRRRRGRGRGLHPRPRSMQEPMCMRTGLGLAGRRISLRHGRGLRMAGLHSRLRSDSSSLPSRARYLGSLLGLIVAGLRLAGCRTSL